MPEVDINTLTHKNNYLIENIPNNIIIVGKIDELIIGYEYDQLDLSKVECNIIWYRNQGYESIKNHILPNSLKELYCLFNRLTSLPKLPNLLENLYCHNNQLISLPNLPNSLQKLYCHNNQLTSLPNLPNSLKNLYCNSNKLTSFANAQLPNSLEILSCMDNQLISLPEFKNKIKLLFNQDKHIEYIPYTNNIQLCNTNFHKNKINILDYPYNPITNQQELDKYMNYQSQFLQNRKKSAKK